MTTAEKLNTYEVLASNGDYTLIDRKTSYCPFVVCWLFNKENYTWAQGHYFNDLEDAKVWMKGER